MGFQMAVTIFLATFAGVKLDGWLHNHIPIFTLVMSLLSVVLSLYYFIRDSSGKRE